MSNYKRFFLPNYNYIFFTIVTYDRRPILINNIELLKKSIKYAHIKYNFSIFAIVVLNDHMHLIIKLENVKEYPHIIRTIKHYFSTHQNSNPYITESKLRKGEKGIWQRRYWEHTIRNEKDLYRHLDYIHFNPVKHKYTNRTKDYVYSSFSKFVENGYYDINWCNFENKHSINELDFE